ncbi:MAG: 4-hydroxy-tetrahydrodipicolinate synthase [Chloroflexota bacterium]
MEFKPTGIIPPLVTPVDHNENLNKDALRQLVERLLGAGVHGVFAMGSQGEFWAFTPEEKREVIDTVVRQVNGRVPVYAGTGAPTTRECIELTRMAEASGADAVSVLTPYFISPSQDELYEHYVAIARSTHLPVVLYGNPGRTGVSLSVDLVSRLSEVDGIVGIKDSSGDLSLTAEYIRNTGPDFATLAGRDTLIYGTLAYGGKGSVAATANAAPALVVEIYNSFVQGDLEKARQAQARLAPLRQAFGLGSFPVVIKDAVTMTGIPVGPARGPVRSLEGAPREKLTRILGELGLLKEQ